MRKLLGFALFASILLLAFLLILPAQKGLPEKPKGKPASLMLGIYSSEIADFGNGTAAVLHMFAQGEEGSFFAYCSEKPIPDSALILKHPHAAGVPDLSQEIGHGLEKCGLSYSEVLLEDALLWKDAVIVAPTGALPARLENNSLLAERNLRLVVAESLKGRAIDENGSISQQAKPNEGYDAVSLLPSHEKEAVPQIISAVLAPKNASLVEIHSRGTELTVPVFLKAKQEEAYCRVYYLSNSSCRFADSGKISKPPGFLHASPSVLEGQEADFELSLSGQEKGRRLLLFAVDYEGRNEAARKKIAEGVVAESWAARFSLPLVGEGWHSVWVIDQFGRRHASALVDVKGFSSSFLSKSGNKLEFEVKFGKQPLTGEVDAWIDNGEKRKFHAANGTLVIWASPSAGNHTIYLSYMGIVRKHSVFFPESPAEAYLRLLFPTILFIIAIFFLLRARSSVKYRITFPEFAPSAAKAVGISKEDLVAAWKCADSLLGSHGLPATAEEIGSCLAKMIANGRQKEAKISQAEVNMHSLRLALRQLVLSGVFLESEGYYIPKKHSGGLYPWQLRALRIIYDLLLEKGVPFCRKKVVAAKKLGIEIALFGGKKSVLARLGKVRRIVVFESEEEISAFRKSLLLQDEDSVRIKIAEQNGKISFAAATRKSLEAVLP